MRVAPSVYVLRPGPLDWAQRCFVGLLHAGGRATITGLTACRLARLRGWDRPEIHVLVVKGRKVSPLAGLRFHESRRDYESWPTTVRGPRALRIEHAALLATESLPRPVSAGLLAACVQQRLTTVARLSRVMDDIGRLNGRGWVESVLEDIAGGSGSWAEITIARRCVAAGLRPPTRQRRRQDAAGNSRYTDFEWDCDDGSTVVLEVDGAFHLEIRSWLADMTRERGLVIDGCRVLRCSSVETRLSFDRVVADLRRAGVPVVTPQASSGQAC